MLTLIKKQISEVKNLADEHKKLVKNYYGDLQYDVVRDMILNDRKRLDGRGLEDVRPLGYGN